MCTENLAKTALNAAKLAKFEAVSSKLSLQRMTAVADLQSHSRLTWFCAYADGYLVFNTQSHIIVADDSTYLNCSTI